MRSVAEIVARAMRTRWPPLVLLVWVAACGQTPTQSLTLPAPAVSAPSAPGPAPRRRTFDAVEMNRRCEVCHETIAAEWRGSLHQRAHVDPSYQTQFAIEPFPFCTGCHAPEADPAGPVAPDVSAMGVGCVSCHVVGDQILAANTADETAPHAVSRSASFAGAMACAGCHEFAFPQLSSAARGAHSLLMQSTVSEHAASRFADKSCADCHMRTVREAGGRTHRDHRFIASRDPELVRSAVVTTAAFDGQTLELRLEPGEVGHAFPTGDLLRRLLLTIEVIDDAGRVVDGHRQIFGRHFGFEKKHNGVPRRVLLRDDRVGMERDQVIRFTPKVRPHAGSIRYELRYQRVGGPPDERGQIPIDGSIVLKEQTLPL